MADTQETGPIDQPEEIIIIDEAEAAGAAGYGQVYESEGEQEHNDS